MNYHNLLRHAEIWEATYLPFGGVVTTSGTPINLRFPGQWFQSETALHQNWMRDYDPTTGRYLQPDPLGLVDGASVYGYARQNPGRYVDRFGLFTLTDAQISLARRGIGRNRIPRWTDGQIFDEWLRLERENNQWLGEVPNCPCSVDPAEGFVAGARWEPLSSAGFVVNYFHGSEPKFELRSQPTQGGHGNQCMYDEDGTLLSNYPAAGSADFYSPNGSYWNHYAHDVHTFNFARRLGRVDDYYDVRPVK